MRVPMATFGLMMAAAGILLSGCYEATAPQDIPRAQRREKTVDVEMSYLVACRSILGELRSVRGYNAVQHEIWPDIQQAGIYVAKVGQRELVISVMITATGPDRCEVTFGCPNEYWSSRSWPEIEKGLHLTPEAAIR
jgi:hypothetical protein